MTASHCNPAVHARITYVGNGQFADIFRLILLAAVRVFGLKCALTTRRSHFLIYALGELLPTLTQARPKIIIGLGTIQPCTQRSING